MTIDFMAGVSIGAVTVAAFGWLLVRSYREKIDTLARQCAFEHNLAEERLRQRTQAIRERNEAQQQAAKYATQVRKMSER